MRDRLLNLPAMHSLLRSSRAGHRVDRTVVSLSLVVGLGVALPASAQNSPAPPADVESATDTLLDTTPDAAVDELAEPSGTRSRYPIDAMVGQVNGQPIYAQAVLEPIDAQLRTLAGQLPYHEFQKRAAQLIASRIKEMLQNALILGEAERDLSEQEQLQVRAMVEIRRRELLRQYGRGSVAMAEKALQDKEGISLREKLESYRQEVVIRRYFWQRFGPLINVSRRDIERYYRDHEDEYNPPARRVLRLIRCQSGSEAQQITRLLEQGSIQFAEAAAHEANTFKRAQGGLFGETVGDAPLRQEAINEALTSLDEGAYAGPIEIDGVFWFVHVERLERGNRRTLQDVQVEIREKLRERQFVALQDQFRQQIFEQGSYTRPEQMVVALLEVAMSRYAPPPP